MDKERVVEFSVFRNSRQQDRKKLLEWSPELTTQEGIHLLTAQEATGR
jgi:hypothetical protein